MPEERREDPGLAPERVPLLKCPAVKLAELGFGLPRACRLLTPLDYAEVRRRSIKGRSRYFRYNLAPNELNLPRIGVTVSRKVSRLAVQRNRIKRQVKERFRFKKNIVWGYDVVFIGAPGAAACSNKEIQNDLRQLWRHLEKQLRLS
jgi:ribonuclease P protein component